VKQKREKTKVDLPDGRPVHVMNTSEIGEMLGIAARTVRELRQHHDLPALGRDSFDAREVFRWAVAAIKGAPRAPAEAGKPTEPGGLSPRDELAVAMRLKVETETQQMRARLLPASLALRSMDQVAEIILDEFARMMTPGLVAQIVAETNPDKIQNMLLTASRISRTEIARRMLELSGRTASGEAFDGADEA